MNLLPAACGGEAGLMTTTQITRRPETDPRNSRQKNPVAGALRPLVLDLGVPLGSYYVMRAAGVALVPALALSSVVPGARAVASLFRDRAVNGLAALIVIVNVVGIAVTFWSGDARLMLAKDAIISSTVGIAVLISVFAGRPLMTAALRPMMVKADAARDAAFARLSATSARFGRLERIFSGVWGLTLLAECVTRVICVFTLPVATMVWLSTVLTVGAVGIGIIAGAPVAHVMDEMIKDETGR
jgi:intracellular septation protein A